MQEKSLESLLRERGAHAFLISVSLRGGPHAICVPVSHEQGCFVADVGAKTAAFVAAQPRVSLLYPAQDADAHSLIVDGMAVLEGEGQSARIRVRPTRIVLHRSAAGTDPSSACDSDCRELPLG